MKSKPDHIKRILPLLILVVVFVLLRGPVFWTSLETFDREQAVTGDLAKDLIDGLVLPPAGATASNRCPPDDGSTLSLSSQP